MHNPVDTNIAGQSLRSGQSESERNRPVDEAVAAVTKFFAQQKLSIALDEILTLDLSSAGFRPAAIVLANLTGSGRVVAAGCGKGIGAQATASAMFEAFEHLAAGPDAHYVVSESEPKSTEDACSRPSRLPAAAIPGDLAHRDAVLGMIRLWPQAISFTPMFECTPEHLTSPNRQLPTYFPTCLLSATHRPANKAENVGVVYRSSNGIASGMSADEALLHAVNELIERDAFGSFLLASGQGHTHGRPADTPHGSLLSALRRAIEHNYMTTVELRVLEAVTGNVVLALSSSFDDRGARILGAGASANLTYAAERSLLELAQELAVEAHGVEMGDHAPSLNRLDNYPTLKAAAMLQHVAGPNNVPVQIDGDSLSMPVAPRHQLRRIIDRLANSGFRVFARPIVVGVDGHTPQVWQAVIPGMERFHLVRWGIPVEPTGRLRNRASLAAVRKRGATDVRPATANSSGA